MSPGRAGAGRGYFFAPSARAGRAASPKSTSPQNPIIPYVIKQASTRAIRMIAGATANVPSRRGRDGRLAPCHPLTMRAPLMPTQDSLPFADLMGVKITNATRESVDAELFVREDLCTRPAVLHGGAL